MAISKTGKQHQELYRKLLLRKSILSRYPPGDGAYYIPFCGAGDIAMELYQGKRLYAPDLDPARIATFQERLPDAISKVANCNGWPFPGCREPFALADLDAYSNPYLALKAFWANTQKDSRVVIFGTDGNLQTINRQRRLVEIPRNSGPICADVNKVRAYYNFWWVRQVVPFLQKTILPYGIVHEMHYRRGGGMLYWGIVAEKK